MGEDAPGMTGLLVNPHREVCYEVKAESRDGHIGVLRRFRTQGEAEDHPVRLSRWKRVWVERREPPEPIDNAPLPWRVADQGMWTYIFDAAGAKVGCVYGTPGRKKEIARIVERMMGCTP